MVIVEKERRIIELDAIYLLLGRFLCSKGFCLDSGEWIDWMFFKVQIQASSPSSKPKR